MKRIKHDEWLFIALSSVGLLALFGMGILNIYLGLVVNGWVEIAVGGIGVINLIWFGLRRKLDTSAHMVLIMMFAMFVYLVVSGGLLGTGWIWVLVYPGLGYALRKTKTASYYVFGLAVVIMVIGVGEWLGSRLSFYNPLELFQLFMCYVVVSLMTMLAERVHEQVEREYLEQGRELEQEKVKITQQADELRMYLAAMEQSSEMMVITDSEGMVIWGNKATELVTGFAAEQAVGLKVGVLWGKLMDKEYYQKLWKTVKTDKKQFVGEILNHRKNGERFYSTITIYPLLDEKGEVKYLVATQRDITQEREVNQMKTDFVSLVSHQLRTPLSSMRWNLEMLLNGDLGQLEPKQHQVVQQVSFANDRMIKLISTLLNISRIESGRMIVEPVQVDLCEYLTEVKKECSVIKPSQRLELDLPPDPVPTTVDLDLLRQILQNFVSNASKYSPEDGVIKLKLTSNQEQIRIEVIDHGYGIPKDEQHKIFGKFFRASNVIKHEVEGTGMGLYVTVLIARLLGGQVGFDSIVNKGSTFWLTLPIKGVAAKAGEVR